MKTFISFILKIGPLKMKITFESEYQKRKRKHQLAEQIKKNYQGQIVILLL
jgi:hypothetical protein